MQFIQFILEEPQTFNLTAREGNIVQVTPVTTKKFLRACYLRVRMEESVEVVIPSHQFSNGLLNNVFFKLPVELIVTVAVGFLAFPLVPELLLDLITIFVIL